MPKPLRYTGQNPPPELFGEFQNWRNAYEEEGEDDQDESTLMPNEEQSFIDNDTSFSAGTVRLHDGREYPAFVAVMDGRIDGCYVYETPTPWKIHFCYPEKKWIPFLAEWLPAVERPPSVSFTDDRIFPMEILMTLPWRAGDTPSRYQISKDGGFSDIGT